MAQPIVILGGFLSFTMLYSSMRDVLARISAQPVVIVESRSTDWLPAILPAGWLILLNKLDRTVCQAAHDAPTGKVTLIGHSAGGVLARLYLSPRPFLGHTYRGLDHVSRLITLGSPHYSQQTWSHGGLMSRWINKRYPGAFFSPGVQYVSVAGKAVTGDRQGSLRELHAYRFYDEIAGDGNASGDGLVPVNSALLQGSHHIMLEDTTHFVGFGGSWYGSEEIVPRWWHACS